MTVKLAWAQNTLFRDTQPLLRQMTELFQALLLRNHQRSYEHRGSEKKRKWSKTWKISWKELWLRKEFKKTKRILTQFKKSPQLCKKCATWRSKILKSRRLTSNLRKVWWNLKKNTIKYVMISLNSNKRSKCSQTIKVLILLKRQNRFHQFLLPNFKMTILILTTRIKKLKD